MGMLLSLLKKNKVNFSIYALLLIALVFSGMECKKRSEEARRWETVAKEKKETVITRTIFRDRAGNERIEEREHTISESVRRDSAEETRKEETSAGSGKRLFVGGGLSLDGKRGMVSAGARLVGNVFVGGWLTGGAQDRGKLSGGVGVWILF